MAHESVRCSHCQERRYVQRCDACQAECTNHGVHLNNLQIPFELQGDPGNRNSSPVLCVPCASGQRAPVDLVALANTPQKYYPDRVEDLPRKVAS